MCTMGPKFVEVELLNEVFVQLAIECSLILLLRCTMLITQSSLEALQFSLESLTSVRHWVYVT